MRKIILLMDDKAYEKILYKSIIDYFETTYEVEIFEGGDLSFDEECLYLTDQNLNTKINSLKFSDHFNDKSIFKYQKANIIISKIEEKLKHKQTQSKAKLVGLIDYWLVNKKGDNRQLAKKLAQEGPTLVISFDAYTRYEDSGTDIGIEDLILSIKLKGQVLLDELINKGKDYDYINSCIDPFELHKLTIEEWDSLLGVLKNSNYRYVLYEMNFSFHPSILYILKNTNHLIFYKLKSYSDLKFKQRIDDLVKKEYLNDTYNIIEVPISNENNNLSDTRLDRVFEYVK